MTVDSEVAHRNNMMLGEVPPGSCYSHEVAELRWLGVNKKTIAVGLDVLLSSGCRTTFRNWMFSCTGGAWPAPTISFREGGLQIDGELIEAASRQWRTRELGTCNSNFNNYYLGEPVPVDEEAG